MAMKIGWINAFSKTEPASRRSHEIYHEGVIRMGKVYGRPDTEIVHLFPDHFAGSIHYPYTLEVNTTQKTIQIIKAEEEGFDAIAIGCAHDASLDMGRGAVKIPIAGALQSAFFMTQFLGRRVGIIGVHNVYNQDIWDAFDKYHVRGRLIENPIEDMQPSGPVFWDMMNDAFQGRPEILIQAVERAGLALVNRGSDVVIMLEVPCSAALALTGYARVADTGVPIVCTSVAALKFAEVMVDIKRLTGVIKSESPQSIYQTPPKEMMDALKTWFWK